MPRGNMTHFQKQVLQLIYMQLLRVLIKRNEEFSNILPLYSAACLAALFCPDFSFLSNFTLFFLASNLINCRVKFCSVLQIVKWR